MIKYWSAVVRQVAPVAGLTALMVGAATLTALLVGDGAPWASALIQSTLVGLTCGVLFALIVTTADTVTAVRTAAHYGLSLKPAAARLPGIRTVAADAQGATAFQLADSALHAIKKAQTPAISEVLDLSHGSVSLICKTPYGPEIRVSIDITITDGKARAVLTCQPISSWKRLDGGSSWVIADTLQHCVQAALNGSVL
ncbi:hypothetical protein ACFYY2_33725 [Streptomyces sp. NPDC001822]|uniref:hypothetical protein n=1 Tax=Streptomyces sp. NPDC001822 TaxID=3364614 RepID=UPI003695071E